MAGVGHVRNDLAEVLRAEIPRTWELITSERAFDVKNKTVVIIKQSAVARAPEAPIGVRWAEFTLTITSRYVSDFARAENDLDNTLTQLLNILDRQPLVWQTATKVLVNETYLGYDIPIRIPLKKENL